MAGRERRRVEQDVEPERARPRDERERVPDAREVGLRGQGDEPAAARGLVGQVRLGVVEPQLGVER